MTNDPWHPDWQGPKELLPLLAAGKLQQVCMECGKRDPAGGPCTRCGAHVPWAYWARNYRSEAQQRSAAQQGKSLGQNRSQGMSLPGVSHER